MDRRILYIDDDVGLSRLVQRSLTRAGYTIETAADGASGVARIREGGVDVVALDHFMPDQNGLETLAIIQSLVDAPSVIYVTALEDGEVAVAALKAGAVDYIAKDVKGDFLPLLQKAIDMALEAALLRREKNAAEIESRRTWVLTQSIVDTIHEALVVLEEDMTIVTANNAFLGVFGITEQQVRGRRITDVEQGDVPALRNLMETVLPGSKDLKDFEIEDDFPGLGHRVFRVNARKIARQDTYASRLLLVFEDITERKQRERDVQLLGNEISHRIKNNLQLIVGLITFEARKAGTSCVSGYRAMQARIGAIAALYDVMSLSNRIGIVTVDDYLRKIANTMAASLLGDASGITIEVDAEPLEIDPELTVPLGLLVNELATNAIKHAFPDGAGRVLFMARKIGHKIELTVSDNGVGLKDAAPMTQSRGLNYVAIFVRQLGGEISTSGAPGLGTTIQVRFPPMLKSGGSDMPIARAAPTSEENARV